MLFGILVSQCFADLSRYSRLQNGRLRTKDMRTAMQLWAKVYHQLQSQDIEPPLPCSNGSLRPSILYRCYLKHLYTEESG